MMLIVQSLRHDWRTRLSMLKIFLYSVLMIIFVCSGARANDADENNARAAQRQQLEQSLESLNTLISEAPSRYHHKRAEVLFRLGKFQEALQDYDTAIRFGSPHTADSCWERGLVQYYLGDFRGGKEQFSRYHRVGALDIENGLWRLLCSAEDEGMGKARETVLDYPRKKRPPFPALLALYLGTGNVEAVLDEAKRGTASKEALATTLFNAHYYIGKYYAITDQNDLALTHIREALKQKIPHFMYACAELDAKRLEDAVAQSLP